MPPRTRARFINLLLTSTMVGNEVGAGIAVHPALKTLPSDAHLQAEQALIRRYLWIMTLWQTGVCFSYLPLLRHSADRALLKSFECYMAMLGVTAIANLPIDLRLLRVKRHDPELDWQQLIRRWDRWHVLRNALNIAALSWLYVSLLEDHDKHE